MKLIRAVLLKCLIVVSFNASPSFAQNATDEVISPSDVKSVENLSDELNAYTNQIVTRCGCRSANDECSIHCVTPKAAYCEKTRELHCICACK
jgi:hypothetical protein